jgi:ABC-2 type transport system ATP-binding protein
VADGSGAEVKAGTAHRTISFTAPPGGLLDTLPAVTGVEYRGERVLLTTNDPEATLRSLLADGGRLPGLEVRGASLEEAVLSLTATRASNPIGADQ